MFWQEGGSVGVYAETGCFEVFNEIGYTASEEWEVADNILFLVTYRPSKRVFLKFLGFSWRKRVSRVIIAKLRCIWRLPWVGIRWREEIWMPYSTSPLLPQPTGDSSQYSLLQRKLSFESSTLQTIFSSVIHLCAFDSAMVESCITQFMLLALAYNQYVTRKPDQDATLCRDGCCAAGKCRKRWQTSAQSSDDVAVPFQVEHWQAWW